MELHLSFIGPIDVYSLDCLKEKIEPNKHTITRLHIDINSLGGSVAGALSIYNYLKALPFEVVTHNLAEVTSAAILIYLAGETRTSEKISKFVIHPIKCGSNGDLSYFQIQELLQILEADIENYAAVVNKETECLNNLFDINECLKSHSIILNYQDAINCNVITS